MNKIGNGPIVSVIIPVFNSQKYIEKTLLSVLEQTYKNYEVIIIDDGSQDNSLDIINKIKNRFNEEKITILKQNHRGAGAARNRGVQHAKADLIAFLDSDDFWFPEKLKKVVNIFNVKPEVDLVSHDLIRIYQNGYQEKLQLHRRYNPRIDYFVNLYKINCLATSTVTIRKSILFKVGLFDEHFPPAEEYDLWLKIAVYIKPYYIKEPLVYYSVREGSQSEDIDRRLQQEINVLKKHFPELKNRSFFAYLIFRRRAGQILGAVGKEWLLRGKTLKAIPLFFMALIQWPFNLKVYLYPLWVLITKLNLDKRLR